MVMRLRLDPVQMSALRSEAARTGKSPNEILLEAIAQLPLADVERAVSDRDRARADGVVRPARVPYRRVTPRILTLTSEEPR